MAANFFCHYFNLLICNCLPTYFITYKKGKIEGLCQHKHIFLDTITKINVLI